MLNLPHLRLIGKIALALVVCALAVSSLPGSLLAPDQAARESVLKLDLTQGWRFKLDPDDIGLKQGWALPKFDDRAWARIDAASSWQSQRFPDVQGYGWYRKSVVVPAGWRGLPLYLWLSGIDDEADVYVDGSLVGHFGDRPSLTAMNQAQIPLDLTAKARAGAAITVAVRVNNWFGDGGITGRPVALATSNTALYSDERLIKNAFDRDPELPWPYWLAQNKGLPKPQGAAWTMLGSEGSSSKSLLGIDGSLMASQSAGAITPWIYDHDNARLYVPAPAGFGSGAVRFQQQDGFLPIVTASWQQTGLNLTSTIFVGQVVAGNASEDVTYYRMLVHNPGQQPRDVSLLLALRPFGVAGRISKLYTIGSTPSGITVNGAVAIVPERAPDRFGASTFGDGEAAEYALRGEVAAAEAGDARGLASALLSYRLRLSPGEQSSLSFKLPSKVQSQTEWTTKVAPDFESARQATTVLWRSRLGAVKLSLPDSRYSDAYYASVGYLLTARNGDLFLPGPLTHRRFWYRDAAYVSLALLRAGHVEVVSSLMEKIVAGQLPSGEFPAILEPDGRPAQPIKHEWDAQGEGIFALTTFYRWTGDEAWLRSVYPAIRSAAGFIAALRQQTQQASLAGTAKYGILPPSESAEDLGPASWHHYWDDFWAIGGLREAAFAADALGEERDAQSFLAEAEALRLALVASIEAVQRAKGIDFIPNGPEDVESSAMARGTTPALWPVSSFPEDDPLLRRSFEVYFQRWIAPNGGAYKHLGDKFWPYGALELGHAYLLLGMNDRVQLIVDWALNNQTFPGLNAWAEAVSPKDNRFAEGDMPHAWAAAEYTLLLRDMLVREDGDELILGSYFPEDWLGDGKRLAISGMPTLLGKVGYTFESHAAAGYWQINLEQGARPKAYSWMVPGSLRLDRVEVDGQDWNDFDGKSVRIPPTARQVRLYGTLKGR